MPQRLAFRRCKLGLREGGKENRTPLIRWLSVRRRRGTMVGGLSCLDSIARARRRMMDSPGSPEFA
jgi:hypothetical protein